MITPFFKLRQDDKSLVVEIRAPNANIRDAEVDFFDRSFYFSSAPYFLRLFLTGDVDASEESTTDYDADTGTFTIHMPKRNKGEVFPQLDMLSELLKPQRSTGQKLIEELDNDEEEEEDDQVQIKQSVPVESSKGVDDEQIREYGYGFGWLRHGVLSKFGAEVDEMFDLRDLETVKISDRLSRILIIDEAAFDSEHYLADLFEEPPQLTEVKKLEMDVSCFVLNDEDRLRLKDLRVVKLPSFSVDVQQRISYSLVDLLFAFLFDLRINEWETNSLTGLMIGKLAPSLSGMVQYSSAKEALCVAVRRSLCYSLYRQFELGKLVAEDTKKLIGEGRSTILHCLLAMHKHFNTSGQEFIYLYNQLHLDQMIVWIQSVDDQVIVNLQEEITKTTHELQRSDIDELDLDYIETAARLLKAKIEDGDYDSDDG